MRGGAGARHAAVAAACLAGLPIAEIRGIRACNAAPWSGGGPLQGHCSGRDCAGCCSSELVQRLRGGVLMGDPSFSTYDSSGSDEYNPEPSGFRRAGVDSRGRFKSNVVSEGADFRPHPDTLHPPGRPSGQFGDIRAASRVHEAAQIPMGGGAASLTPMMARHMSRVVKSVFENEISPVLKKTGTRFAAVVSPLRVSKLPGVLSPLVLGTPRRSSSPDEISSSPVHERGQHTHDRPAEENHPDDPRVLGGNTTPRVPVTPSGQEARGSVAGIFGGIGGAGTRACNVLRSSLSVVLQGGAEAWETIDTATASAVLVGYLLPGVLYGLRILIWVSLHCLRSVVLVVIDSFSAQSHGSPRQRPAWATPVPFPRSTPIPATLRTLVPGTARRAWVRGELQAGMTPPPPYEAKSPGRACAPSQAPVRNADSQEMGGAEDLSLLARKHREFLQNRDQVRPGTKEGTADAGGRRAQTERAPLAPGARDTHAHTHKYRQTG